MITMEKEEPCMKKVLGFAICCALLFFSATGCGNKATPQNTSSPTATTGSSPERLQSGVVPHNIQIQLGFDKFEMIQLDGLVPSEEGLENEYKKEGGVRIHEVDFEKTVYYFKDDKLEMLNYTNDNVEDPDGDFAKLKDYLATAYGEGKIDDTDTRKRISWENNTLNNGSGYTITLSSYPDRKSISLSILMLS